MKNELEFLCFNARKVSRQTQLDSWLGHQYQLLRSSHHRILQHLALKTSGQCVVHFSDSSWTLFADFAEGWGGSWPSPPGCRSTTMPPQPLSIRQNSLPLPFKNKHFFILHFQQPKFTGFSAGCYLANYDFFYIQEFGYCLAGNGPYAEWCDRKLVNVCRVGRNDRTYVLIPQVKNR